MDLPLCQQQCSCFNLNLNCIYIIKYQIVKIRSISLCMSPSFSLSWPIRTSCSPTWAPPTCPTTAAMTCCLCSRTTDRLRYPHSRHLPVQPQLLCCTSALVSWIQRRLRWHPHNSSEWVCACLCMCVCESARVYMYTIAFLCILILLTNIQRSSRPPKGPFFTRKRDLSSV